MHIGWGPCDRLCPVLVCRGRYGLGGGVLLFILGSNFLLFILGSRSRTGKGSSGGGKEGGGVKSGPGAARTILLSHIVSARSSKQPLMVRTFLKVYMEIGSYFFFLQEQIKDIIIIYSWKKGRSCEGAELVGVLVAETIHPACMRKGGRRGGKVDNCV